MPFSFFKTEASDLNEEARFKLALELCDQAIRYCETTIRDEILKMAVNTGNHRGYYQPIKNFQEATIVYSNWSYLMNEATVKLYAKRDVFLNLQKILIGESIEKLKTMDQPNNILIKRTSEETTRFKEQVNSLKNSSINKETISVRFKNANEYINKNETQKIINQIRDTSEIDGWFWGAIKALVRIFTKEPKSLEKINEIQKFIL